MEHSHGHNHELNVKKIDKLSPTKVRLTIEFPAHAVKDHEASTAKRYLASARIPGFRVGKAPIQLIRDKYKDDIRSDVLSHLMEVGVSEALSKTKLDPVTRPSISLVNEKPTLDTAFEFHAEFEVQPEVTLSKYKKIPLKKAAVEVTEKEVTEAFDNFRDRFSELEPVENAEPKAGLYAVIELGYELVEDPKISEAPKSFTVELGAQELMPSLEDAVMKLKMDEKTTVEAEFPAQGEAKLAGKKARFNLHLIGLKKKKMPEATDAWLETVRPGTTLEKFKEEIRQTLQESKQENETRNQRNQVVDYLIQNNPFEVATALVDRQLMKYLKDLSENYKARGIQPKPLGEKEVTELRGRAEQVVRGSLLLQEVAVKEKLEVDEALVDQKIEKYAKQVNQTPESLKNALKANGGLDQLREEVLTDQVYSFLMGQSA